MAAYFISDAHLGLGSRQEEKAKEDRILAFLREAMGDAEQLYIIGDLFDFWFDYATVVPRGFHRTLTALQEYTDSGRKVHYLVGNHDCWMKDFFETEIGVQLHREPFEATIQGKRVYMHHGDGLADNDLGYRLIKPLLRNALAVRMFRLLHPDIAVRIARGTSHSSRAYTSSKHYGEEQGMIRFAEERIAGGCDIVIMGHHHKPSSVSLGHGLYVNLGDWITYNTYGRMQDGAIALKTWNGH
ncbi:MAG TPA: UDP-2,3-diacylglucosamine diphosphatase [Bacteroidota bacterium]|nr:UDP-2,3-diacylglucosamine diphosphatase [Bacteroidota bacterium]